MKTGNDVGNEILILVIQKSSKPRCFKSVKFLTPGIPKSTKELDEWGPI